MATILVLDQMKRSIFRLRKRTCAKCKIVSIVPPLIMQMQARMEEEGKRYDFYGMLRKMRRSKDE